jgi:hypothetical protein
MQRNLGRRAAVAALSLVVLAAGAGAAALIPANAPAAPRATDGAVHLRLNLQRFQFDRAHKRLVAHGNVVATYRSDGRVEATTVRGTTFTVRQATSSCKVLHLELGELHLVLLGLYVNLTPVNAPSIVLDISANSDEALGHLFCQVLNAVSGASTGTTTTAAATKATRKLNSGFASKYGGGVINTTIPLATRTIAATTTAATTTAATTTAATTTTTTPTVATGQCPVLDLVLGPLNLDLLGLVVQLNQIDLNISADPTGTLGSLFCGLAGTTSTASTTAPTTT